MGGKGSGPRKKDVTLLKEALKTAEGRIGEILGAMVNKALGHYECPNCGHVIEKCPVCGHPVHIVQDKDCAIYVVDRVMGRPRQEMDMRVKGKVTFTAEELRVIESSGSEDQKLIDEYGPKQLPPGKTDGDNTE